MRPSALLPMIASPADSIMGKRDRKSTRLNSSHGYISYAVFCLKKKKKRTTIRYLRSNPRNPRISPSKRFDIVKSDTLSTRSYSPPTRALSAYHHVQLLEFAAFE